MMPIRLGQPEPPRLPRIVWTDLVFRVPWCKAPSKAVCKETERSEQNTAAASKLQPESSIFRKKNGKMKPSHLCPEGDTKEKRESTPHKTPSANPPLSAPGKVTTPEKSAIKKILVDLRPILENVMDPLASGQDETLEKDPRKSGCSSPSIGGFRGEGFIRGGGDRTTKMATIERGEGPTVEMTTIHSQEEDISRPPAADPFRASDSEAKTPESQLGESTQLRKNNSPAVLTLQPQFKTPFSFPKITPQQWALLETDNSTEPPAAPSPDFQLPTQLLLQRLQETTTTTHHLLITQVLSSLREELLAPGLCSGNGEKQDTSPEAPQTKTRRSRATHDQRKELNASLEATKRRLRKFTWIRDRPLYGTGGEEAPPDFQTPTGLKDKDIAGLDPLH